MLPISQITKSFYWRVGHLTTGRRCRTYLTLWTLMEMAYSVWRSTTFLSCAPVERNVIRMPGWFAKVIISLWRARDVCRCVTRCVWNDLQELSCFCFFVGRTENFDMRKNQLTRQGFMELNLMEATEKDGDPADLWISLEAMGYNRMLELAHVCIIHLKQILAWF